MGTQRPTPAPATGASPLVLVVDDDDEVAGVVSRFLQGHGLRTLRTRDARTTRDRLSHAASDLVLLDLGLSDEDGLLLLRHLEQRGGPPAIVVSGRGAASERVIGLELGAHDYLAKPFDLHELLPRIRGVLRRGTAARPTQARLLDFDRFTLDVPARTLRRDDGTAIALTSGEFALLRTLLDHAHEVLSRDTLMSALHSRGAGPFDRSIDVGIGRLRRKLEAAGARPGLLQAVRGAGYVLTADVTGR